MIEGVPSHNRKLAGIRRYCSERGWTAVPIMRDDVSVDAVRQLLKRYRPAGCVVDGVGCHVHLAPRIFRGIPVSYIAYPRSITGRHPNFHFDSGVIADTAFRELSAGNPSCFAAVGLPLSWDWSRARVRRFLEAAAASGARCLSFPAKPISAHESYDDFVARLAPWLARLPDRCAVFAVSDETAVLVTRAAAAAGRHIPRSLTLLSVDNFTELCEGAVPPISSTLIPLFLG